MPGQFPNREYDSDAAEYEGPTTTTGMQTRSTTAKRIEKNTMTRNHITIRLAKKRTNCEMKSLARAQEAEVQTLETEPPRILEVRDPPLTSHAVQPRKTSNAHLHMEYRRLQALTVRVTEIATSSLQPTRSSRYNLRNSSQNSQAQDGRSHHQRDTSYNSETRHAANSSERDPHNRPHWTDDRYRSPSASSNESRSCSRSRSRSPHSLDIDQDLRGRQNHQRRRRRERKVVSNTAMVDLGPFYGKDNSDEDFEEWILQLRAAMDIGEIEEDKKIKVLTVKLKGKAFTHFQQLKPPHNLTFEAAVKALKKTFVNPNQHLKYRIRFSKRNFRMGEESIENYAAVLTKIASLAFKNKADAEARVADRFVEGLPNRLKKKCLMFQDKPLPELLEYVSKLLVIDEYCPGEEAGAFNAITPGVQNTLFTVLNEIQSAQNNMQKQVQNTSTVLDNLQNQTQNTSFALDHLQKQVEDEAQDRRYDVEEQRNYKRSKDQVKKKWPQNRDARQNYGYGYQQQQMQPQQQQMHVPMQTQQSQSQAMPQPPVQMQTQPMTQQTQQVPPQVPQMQVPQMQVPQMQVPQMQVPQMQVPQMQIPQMQVPQMQEPMQVSQAQMQQMQAPMNGQGYEWTPRPPRRQNSNGYNQNGYHQNGYNQNGYNQGGNNQNRNQQRYGSTFQKSTNAFCNFCGNYGHKQMECYSRKEWIKQNPQNQKN